MNPTYTVTIGGTETELKMSYGLLNEVARVVGDIEAIPQIAYDIELRTALLTAVLSKRDKKGKITEEADLFNLDMDGEEVIDLLNWVGEHVLDFFIKSLTRAKKLLGERKADLEGLTSI